MNQTNRICVCIPTYRRKDFLGFLLEDLNGQSVKLDLLVVVDGAPSLDPALSVLQAHGQANKYRGIVYVPSNHGNLPYQRYLGWRVAKEAGTDVLLYLDDDLRLTDPAAVGRVVEPLFDAGQAVVGCTAQFIGKDLCTAEAGGIAGGDPGQEKKGKPFLVRMFGAARHLPPGSVSPSGSTTAPTHLGSGHAKVEWLAGRVMAYRMKALGEDVFSFDLFATYERKRGKAEDTFMSLRVRSKGTILTAFHAGFEHPNGDAPRAYPTEASRFGFAVAYSRRLLNDNYRWPATPTLWDRLALCKSYAGNTLLNLFQALRSANAQRCAYAWGYLCGALKGVFQPPSHQRLTPDIDWHADAEAALSCRADLVLKTV